MIFKDRFDAAERLAEKLKRYKGKRNVVILAIPRGALQIGSVLAKKLSLPLDIILAKKIGHPHNPELAVGAVSLKGEFIDPQFADVSKEYISNEIMGIRKKLKERAEKYRRRKPAPELEGKTVIIVDDGIAMGPTMIAAVDLIRKEKAKKSQNARDHHRSQTGGMLPSVGSLARWWELCILTHECTTSHRLVETT